MTPSRSLPRGETHAGAAVRAKEWIGERIEVRAVFQDSARLSSVACSPMTTDYKVKLEIFEGPLDLLLYLIKRDELDIYDISIERITRQYLEYLQAFKELNIDVAGEFIVMAANLLYIKSRSLLPVDQQPP
jgi:hypothetical protein